MWTSLRFDLYRFLLFRYGSEIKEAVSYSTGIPIIESSVVNIETDMVKYPVGINIDKNISIVQNMCIQFMEKTDILSEKNRNKTIKIFCTGESGTIIAGLFAQELLKKHNFVKVINIPKRKEKTHRELISEIENDSDTISIFVDDHIHSAETFFNVYSKIAKKNNNFKFDYAVVSTINKKATVKVIKRCGFVETLVYNEKIK